LIALAGADMLKRMSFKEYDFDNPVHRRRRPPQIEGEVLSSSVSASQPQPRTAGFERPRNVRIPRWAVALLAFGVLAMLFPFGLVVGLVIIAILALMYPAQAFIFVACLIVATIIIALDRRRRRVTISSD
jgi:hypothetical protein